MTERQTHELFVSERETKPSNNHHIDKEAQALAESETVLKIFKYIIYYCYFIF